MPSGISSQTWKKKRETVFFRDNYKCVECGFTGSTYVPVKVGGQVPNHLTVDHIVPRCKGGSRTGLWNLQTLCAECNQRKGSEISIVPRAPEKL